MLLNPQQDLAALAPLLVREVRRGSWLDAFLIAAGLNQIVDDWLNPEVYPLDNAAEYLAVQGRIGGRAAKALSGVCRGMGGRRPGARRVTRWARRLAGIVEALAGTVATAEDPPSRVRIELLASCTSLVNAAQELPVGVRRSMIRLPACFRNLDQQPADLARLAGEVRHRWPDRQRPLVVVGVRTSGSYQAPLCAAYLKAAGWEHVEVLTVRPGRRLLPVERALVRSAMRRGGLGLLVDDPPVTGTALATAARLLESAGATPETIVPLIQLCPGGGGLPAALGRYPSVVLPPDAWAIAERFSVEAVQRDLSALVGPGTSVLRAERAPLPSPPGARGHRRALYRVTLRDDQAGTRTERHLLVEGVGLGWLGTVTPKTAAAVPRFSPEMFGINDGLLYREWLPDEQRVDAPEGQLLTSAIAAYVTERRRALAVPGDMSLRLVGHKPVWEVASSMLSGVFGRAWPVAKVAVVDRVVRQLLHVDEPSVVDGRTDPAWWFSRDSSERGVVKVQPANRSFSHLGLACFDPAFDLAGATARTLDPAFPRRLRRAYAELGNAPVDEERCLLYELAHLWDRERRHPEEAAELRRARSRALQRYFADVYLADVTPSSSGPLCALDVDGVLETEHLGFPSLTPAAARALRALMLHGYRPVLATGRSVDEVAERCRAYRLAGGVAEYGAVTYTSEGRRVRGLVAPGAAAALERVRSALREVEGVQVDRDYQFAVRAYTGGAGGARRGLAPETTAACLERAGADGIRAIPGDGQTDFVVEGWDKGVGLRALADELSRRDGSQPARPFALAVGDTASDLAFAGLAARACAPAHARAALGAAGFEIMRLPYQAGLAQAVAGLLGHEPGACSICRPSPLSAGRELLLTLLAAQERGGRGLVTQAVKLAVGSR